MIYMAAFSFLLVVYSFIPAPAVRVWTRHKEQIFEIKLKLSSSFRKASYSGEASQAEITSMV
jgi:hypothetical protein